MAGRIKGVLVSSALAASVGSASAATVFQSIPDLAAAYAGLAASDLGGRGYQVFDTFSLSSPANITDVWFDVQTAYFSLTSTSVTLSVWSLSAGPPGTSLFSQTVPPTDFLSVVNNGSTSTVEVSLAGLDLSDGTYDISFYNPDILGVPWYSGGSGLAYWAGPGANFFLGGSAGFALCTAAPCVLSVPPPPPAVPEASTWAMMLLGFASLGFVAYRRARAGQAILPFGLLIHARAAGRERDL